MKNPNLFIVGAAKSGTTTLYSYLKKHSEVFMPENELDKEPAFFSIKGEMMGYEKYESIFSNAGEKYKYIGEASTAYLTDPSSAQRLYEHNPNSKIIIILRNPADRAYSLYNWMVQSGYEYANSFEKALILENKRKHKQIPNFFEPEYYWNYMYFTSGLYYEQVKRYVDLFKKENIFIIKFEDMVKNINSTYLEVSNFLNIDYEEIDFKKENESKMVYNPLLSFVVKKTITNLNRLIRYSIIPNKLVDLLQKEQKPKSLNINIKKELLKNYLNDINLLETLINKNLSEWKEEKI